MTINDYWAPIRPLLEADGYKIDHRRQYPEGTEFVYSNWTNRGSRIEGIDHVVHFGLQAFLARWSADWDELFFAAEKATAVSLYREFNEMYLGKPAADQIGVSHIAALHDLGYLPLKVKAVPEGTLVPLRVPSFTIENTLPEFFWLVNFAETVLSASIWQPSTTATLAHRLRTYLDEQAILTTGSTDGVEFQGHDFSARGMAGSEAGAASGAAHLLSFRGTDALLAVDWATRYYSGDNGWIAASVAATEHSVMCAGGSSPDSEQETYRRMIEDVYPTGIVSIVSDTWDLWNVLTTILPNLKDKILARDGKVVIRPDSGDPVDILTGKKQPHIAYPLAVNGVPVKRNEAEDKGVVELLWDLFGGTVTEQGYKVLDPRIGAIYGDSITYERAVSIVERLKAKGFASTNVVFGVGSYTYQYQTRDTFMSAMKATDVVIKGEEKAIFKDPATDNGTKKSARGRLVVVKAVTDLTLVDGLDIETQEKIAVIDQLQTIWVDGSFVKYQSFDNVRLVLGNLRG